MYNSNTHQPFVNLIDDKVELILTARSISRDEKAYAEEMGVMNVWLSNGERVVRKQ